jgi:iron complex outermembrane receptor protein
VVSDIYKQSIEYSSGLIDGQWLFSGRFSKQRTGGYRANSWYDGWAYYLSAARLDPNMTTQVHIYGGPMRMHLAYYGASLEALQANRRSNPLSYDNETDNFNQPHYQLQNTYHLSQDATLFNTLYYIRGEGYYEQLKQGEDYTEYNLTAYSDSSSGNVVRQQWVKKHQFGWNPRLNIDYDRGSHSFGGSFYYFNSEHWGQVVWAQFVNSPDLDPRYRYYEYFGKKWVGSVYAQEYFEITDRLSTQVTAQLRYQRYKFDQTRMGAFNGYRYDVDWLFFSPRVGFSYDLTDHVNLYTNFAVSSRTPTDASIYDANEPSILPSLNILSTDTSSSGGDTLVTYKFGDPLVKSERVYNYELGGKYRADVYALGLNFYWMDFRHEIIPYGGINENTGLLITTNADRSVHAGVEFTASVAASRTLSLSGNFAYNYNRIKDYTPVIDGFAIDFADQIIPGFPEILANVIADYHRGPLRLTYRGRVAGRQYMELHNIDSLSIDPYFISSVSTSYTFSNLLNVGDLTFSAKIDNLFNKKYLSSGYGGNYAFDDNGVVVGGWAEYFPAAERSFYGQIKLELF